MRCDCGYSKAHRTLLLAQADITAHHQQSKAVVAEALKATKDDRKEQTELWHQVLRSCCFPRLSVYVHGQ